MSQYQKVNAGSLIYVQVFAWFLNTMEQWFLKELDKILGVLASWKNTKRWWCQPSDNPLVFWLQHSTKFSILNRVTRRVFIAEASSAESDWYFSCAGVIIMEKHDSLVADTLPMLVLLKLNS